MALLPQDPAVVRLPGAVVEVRERLRRSPVLADLAFAAVLCALDLFLSGGQPQYSGGAGGWAAVALVVAGYLPLGWRRRFPGWVFVAMLAHSLLVPLLLPGFLPLFGVWQALYTVAARCSLPQAVVALVASSLPIAANAREEARVASPGDKVITFIGSASFGTMVNLAVFGVGLWAAWSVRQRRIVAERAAAAAVAAERGRIARDLHDLVAHSLSLMLLQAGGAKGLLRRDPTRAESALARVDDLGQQAIVELRRLLELVETGGASPGGRFAGGEPPSGLEDIRALVEQVRAGGIRVELDVIGDPVPLDQGVSLSGYRIVQEALTNATRYGDTQTPVSVGMHWRPEQVEVRVVNQPAGRTERSTRSLSTGRGILGMHERARAAGGSLQVGPGPDSEFVVVATLPVAHAAEVATVGAGAAPEQVLGDA